MVLVSALFLFSGFSAYAGSVNEIEPRFIGTKLHYEDFNITSGSRAYVEANLTPKAKDSFDKVTISISVLKKRTGSKVYSASKNATYNAVRNRFSLYDEFSLPSYGLYEMQATYKCYKSNKLIETIVGNSVYLTYE